MPRNNTAIRQQQGAALLLMMLVVSLAMSTLLVTNLNRDEIRARRQIDTRAALAIARAALIDYALINADVNAGRSISLPCPDIDASGGLQEGVAHRSSCGAAGETVMGRLPWRTLGLTTMNDASETCLWYVVSGSYKDADSQTAALINVDSNGQLQLFSTDGGSVIEGNLPQDRPVAMVVAAMRPVAGQARAGVAGAARCAPGFDAIDYLESDAGSGVSNAVLSGAADTIDTFAMSPGIVADHNDRIATITRADIERRVIARADFEANMRELGLAIAACLANYAASNPVGAGDKRFPWPSTVALTDYRPDASYDDSDTGYLSGRLPDIVADSNSSTSNPIARVLSECDPAVVPQWTAVLQSRWQNWKDHFFYAVAEAYSPAADVPNACGGCLTVNGSGQYAALVVFSNTRLNSVGQIRNAPPIDSDTRLDAANYLEGVNADNVPGTAAPGNSGNAGNSVDYVSGAVTDSFNDILFCIDEQLAVTEC